MILPEPKKLAQLKRDLEITHEQIALLECSDPLIFEKLEATTDKLWGAILQIDAVIAMIGIYRQMGGQSDG